MFADPHAYQRFMGRWSQLLAPRFAEFAGIADGWRVLDVGSGSGSLALAIASRHPGCRIVGIEPSADYVSFAASRAAGANVHFSVGAAEDLPFAAASFDAGVSLLVFNFLRNPQRALAELRRVTRPGGKVCAAVWDYADGMRMLRIFWDAASRLSPGAGQADEARMPLCRPGELGALWRAGGITAVEERPLEIAMRFESFDDYWEPFLLGQAPAGAYVAQLAPEDRFLLRDQLKQLLPPQANAGAFDLSARAWAVRGTAPGSLDET